MVVKLYGVKIKERWVAKTMGKKGKFVIMKLIIVMLVLAIPQATLNAGGNSKNIVINNKLIEERTQTNSKGTTMIPLKSVLTGVGYGVEWDSKTSSIGVYKNKKIDFNVKVNSNRLNKGSKEIKLSDSVKVIKGTSYAPIDILDKLGIDYDDKGNKVGIYTKFMIVHAGQDNLFVEKSMRKQDLDKINNILYDFAIKNRIRYEQRSYIDTRSIEDMYEYISEKPSKQEIETLLYSWGNYLNTDANKHTVNRLNKLKTLAPLAGIEMGFEPAVYYVIGGEVELIGGYINYGSSDLKIYDVFNNYVKNYEEVTWTLMRDSTKSNVKTELAKLVTGINKENRMVIFLLKDGNITYME